MILFFNVNLYFKTICLCGGKKTLCDYQCCYPQLVNNMLAQPCAGGVLLSTVSNEVKRNMLRCKRPSIEVNGQLLEK